MSESLRRQYATDANLQARIGLHARFATNPGWGRWLFEHELGGAPAAARILEMGCGPATTLWGPNLDRIDASWRLTLADFSPGMIEAAREVLGQSAEYVVADVQQLPFADGSFDVVLANHMLYHVPDRPQAFAEIRRVLVPGGFFHAATNGRGHFEELQSLVGPEWPFWRHNEAFGLETGPPQLKAFFADVRVERFETGLAVTEVEPVLAYVRSSESYDGGDLSHVEAAVEAAIARDGVFRITTTPGLITCRKP
jgi:ubiquinone/menaquinone biosynthesis C-methylase UbiE